MACSRRLPSTGTTCRRSCRRELIRTGVEQGARLKRLLEELLDLSRLDSRGVRVDPKPLVLGSLLRQIVTETIPGGPRTEIDVPDSLAVVADRLVIDRVVSNLLTNAARYGQEPITLSGSRSDMHVRIAVEDSGPGVSDEVRPRLFERFARADSAVGSGLGLSIARAYARAHGGTSCTSSATGRALRVDPASADLSKASQRRLARTRRAAISVPATVSTSFTAFEPRSFDSPLARSSIVTGTSRTAGRFRDADQRLDLGRTARVRHGEHGSALRLTAYSPLVASLNG